MRHIFHIDGKELEIPLSQLMFRCRVKNGFSRKKLIKAAEKLRNAKLNVFKARFSQESVLPASSYMPDKKAKIWEALSIDEIIDNYTQKKNNQ